VLTHKGFSALVADKIPLSHMALLMVSQFGGRSKHFITLVTRQVFQMGVFDVCIKVMLVEVYFPTYFAGHAEGGMSICEVRSDINFVRCDFLTAYCARDFFTAWVLLQLFRGLSDPAKALMIGKLVLGSE